ncbi:hypothetical protein GGS26DRAFT_391730 [Hypomontagnella submonticulosa]|nr:hypothetical protein GGS26DRAFT_391730 [Hypomontagnella submonticulosa]
MATEQQLNEEDRQILPYTQLYHPTILDAERARLLLQTGLQPTSLPPELAIHIVSLGYNPWGAYRRVCELQFEAGRHPGEWDGNGDAFSVAGLYLSTGRIPRGGNRTVVPERVVFQTRAADQGWATWGGEGTFGNSHTWFEASILRPIPGTEGVGTGRDGPLEEVFAGETWWDVRAAGDALREKGWEFVQAPDGRVAWRVCNNITACSDYQNYKVEWKRGVETVVEDEMAVGRGEGFLESLGPGCVVVLWARAQQVYWCNKVQAATIEIEYRLV